MKTNAKVINNLSYIRNKTQVKFKKFGTFFLKLLFLSKDDQEFLVFNLRRMADKAKKVDMIKIISFSRPKIKLTSNEQRFRFLIEYEFRCYVCDTIHTTKTNSNTKKFINSCIKDNQYD